MVIDPEQLAARAALPCLSDGTAVPRNFTINPCCSGVLSAAGTCAPGLAPGVVCGVTTGFAGAPGNTNPGLGCAPAYGGAVGGLRRAGMHCAPGLPEPGLYTEMAGLPAACVPARHGDTPACDAAEPVTPAALVFASLFYGPNRP